MKEISLNINRVVNLKNRKRIFKNNLKIEVIQLPESRDINNSKLYKKKIKFNNKLYVYDSHDMVFDLYLGGGTIILGLLGLLILSYIEGIIFLSGILFFIGVLIIISSWLKRNNKKLILDRNQTLISYPDYFFKKPIVTKFENTVAIIGGTGSYGALILKLRQTSFFTNYHINNYAPLKYWSFMVWYMDKNRPLPPGNAFDSYRDKDFKRRKTEGFPPPLYRSAVPTPEATPEQQAERERYWRDEDYMCPEFKREKDAVLFDVNVHTDWLPFQYSEVPLQEGSYNTWHRYEFTDGSITYMRTDAYGKGYRPPQHIECKESIVTIKKSWWE